MNPVDLNLSVSTCLVGEPAATLSDAIRQAIEAHLRKDSAIHSANLQIVLNRFGKKGVYATATMSVAGTVNHRPIRKQFTRKRNLSRSHASGGGAVAGIVGALVVAAVTKAVSSAVSKAFSGPQSGKLTECLDECLADVMLLIDKTAGRAESPLAARWRIIRWARWGAAAVAFVLSWIAGMSPDAKPLIGLRLFAALLHAVAIFLCVHLIALAFMPNRFFLEEPQGKKALALSGVPSVGVMRVLVVVLAIIILVFVACSGVGLLSR